MFDILCIVPCTGNTLAKLANGIADTSVTMAAKSHLRNSRPVILGVSTNDALGAAAKNIGNLMNYKTIILSRSEWMTASIKPSQWCVIFHLWRIR